MRFAKTHRHKTFPNLVFTVVLREVFSLDDRVRHPQLVSNAAMFEIRLHPPFWIVEGRSGGENRHLQLVKME
ncbi:MAG: hypothetical protein WBE20_02140 [Candidatus Acidiferrales bacterium]